MESPVGEPGIPIHAHRADHKLHALKDGVHRR